ncbi:hypothetical protein [uncultured Metabacillus sp.]|uniref:hypothetical protein n=1 Tax=uncultured Metabacillus sp. TaxID=2860135 RepID=UPI002637D48E|nr:hypothetical protein [uncultured Metabacillus sp.]
MNTEKRAIIINEIYQWRSNKLLPETYCDFLLALYTEGNQKDKESQSHKKRNLPISTYWVLYGLLFSFFSLMLLIVYFTELPFVLQMTIVGFSLLFSIAVTAYFIGKRAFFQVPLTVLLIQLLILSLNLTEFYTYGDTRWIGGMIVANCLLWIFIGAVYRLLYLFISGISGFLIFVASIIF